MRRVLAAAGRIALLTAAASAWWIVGLAVEDRYGADVLAYSETVRAVSTTSLASEVLRGLGYWLFYGGDVTGRWNSASTVYLTSPALIVVGFGLAAAAVLALVWLGWRERTWLVALVLIGVVVSVGAHPIDDPSPLGSVIARLGAVDDRPRPALVDPSPAPGAAGLRPGSGGVADGPRDPPPGRRPRRLARRRRPRRRQPADAVERHLRRRAAPAAGGDPHLLAPTADALTAGKDGTRALELPGAEFAAYRWGTTNDSILPGLTTRPTLTRDLLPLGGAGTMDLLDALDNRFQNGTIEAAAIAPVARLLGAGAIVFRGDTAFERYRTARPEPTWALYAAGVPGLSAPETFGTPAPNVPAVAMTDEAALSDPRIGQPIPPAALMTVEDPEPIVRATDAAAVTVVDGSGDGLVDAAAAGLLNAPGTVLQSAAFAGPAARPRSGPRSRRAHPSSSRTRTASRPSSGAAPRTRPASRKTPVPACCRPTTPTPACPSFPAPAPKRRRSPSSGARARGPSPAVTASRTPTGPRTAPTRPSTAIPPPRGWSATALG